MRISHICNQQEWELSWSWYEVGIKKTKLKLVIFYFEILLNLPRGFFCMSIKYLFCYNSVSCVMWQQMGANLRETKMTIFSFRLYLHYYINIKTIYFFNVVSQSVSRSETLDWPIWKARKSTGALTSNNFVIKHLIVTVHYSQNFMIIKMSKSTLTFKNRN